MAVRSDLNAAKQKRMDVTNTSMSKNPFVTDITETFGANVANGINGGRAGNRQNTNPFAVSMELTQANGAAEWLLTPPPSTNPFTQPAVQQKEAAGEFVTSSRVSYTPAAPLPTVVSFPTLGQIINPFAQMNSDCFTTSTPVSRGQALFHPQTVSLATPCMPQYITPSHAVQDQSCGCKSPRVGPPSHHPSPHSHPECPIDSSDDECYGQRERIPVLRPGQFDRTGVWKDFLYQFESCASANHWSEKTMVVQLRFSLTGAAGAIIHKNPLGLASYYRRFVEDFATIAKPLHELTKKYARFHWTAECQDAFEELKTRLSSAPVLAYPLDSCEFFLDTDASNWGIGAVLSQLQGGEERVLAYGSRRLSSTEQNYCTTRRELLAVVEFVSHFRQYLLGRPFTVRTDHSSLRWLTRL